MKRFLAAAAVSLVALTGVSASASTVRLDYTTASSPFGSPNLSERVRIEGPGRSATNVLAGPFRMTDHVNEIVAWCFDIAQHVGNRVTYHTASNPLGDARASLLNRLFTSFYHKVDTPTEGAAFQVAIWEIVYESLDDPFNVRNGIFEASRNHDVTRLANHWLHNLGTEENYRISYFMSEKNQDLLTATPVPLPAGRAPAGAPGSGRSWWHAAAARWP